MLYLKEDDMDEMMRKAAENYDIDAGRAADWNAVYNAVHTTEPPLPPAPEKKRRRRFAFWWLLLIPLGWIANNEYNKFKAAPHDETAKNQSSVKQETIKTEQPSAANKKQVETAPVNNNKEDVVVKSDAEDKGGRNNNAITKQNNAQPAKNGITAFHPLPVNKEPGINPSQKNELKENQAVTDLPAENNSITNNNVVDPGHNNEQPVDAAQNNLTDLSKTKTGNAQANTANASKKLIKNPKGNNHYFYAGLAGGADLSFIKYQSTRPLGYNVGLLAGYKFNKLSIESGFYIDKKNYYTSGKYFDKSSIAYFQNAKILTVDGYCTMFEIPVNLKYNFIEKKNHTWFATAGVSSYLMNKEFYNYDYIRDGEQHNGSRAYYHTTQNWFSVLNLSAGYELKTGKKTSLRIEPYYKTSLNGLGTGKLSISSAGINAGLVRRIP